MITQPVELVKLRFPESRPYADPAKLARHGKFSHAKFTPIIVERDRGGRLWLMDGVTRVVNAQQAGITHLDAYVYERE